MSDKLQLEFNARVLKFLCAGAKNRVADPDLEAAEKLLEQMSNKPERKKEPREIDAQYHWLAGQLSERILRNNPRAKITPKQLEAWAREVDLMIRVDVRSFQDIYKLIEWSQRDSFWHRNVLSMRTIRDKFDRFWLESGNGKPNPKGAGGTAETAGQASRFSADARRAEEVRRKLGS